MAPLEVAPRAWRAGREGFGDPKLADLGGLSAALAPAIPALVLGAKIALASPVAGALTKALQHLVYCDEAAIGAVGAGVKKPQVIIARPLGTS